MAKNNNQIALLIAIVFTIYSCSNDTLNSNPTESVPERIVDYNYSNAELETMDLINEYRVSNGLNILGKINYISVKSEEHNIYMITNDIVTHDNFVARSEDIIKVLGVKKVSENIAYNYNSPQAALNAWLDSPEHKKIFWEIILILEFRLRKILLMVKNITLISS
ncbi:CAP domain-containing protein [Flavobacterium sp. YO12]|uniref:CAP domain-containing protein n=1 Tax=Flavobacterium sp. YO12 TaxID=1920029 RepID=UPI0026B17D8F